MNAYLSADAGFAILVESDGSYILRADDPGRPAPSREEERNLIHQVVDVEFLEDTSEDEVRERLSELDGNRNILMLLLMTADEQLSDSARCGCAALVEEKLLINDQLRYLRHLLYATPISDETGFQSAVHKICSNTKTPNLLQFFRELLAHQSEIRRVSATWTTLNLDIFPIGRLEGDRIIMMRHALVSAGAFYMLARALKAQTPLVEEPTATQWNSAIFSRAEIQRVMSALVERLTALVHETPTAPLAVARAAGTISAVSSQPSPLIEKSTSTDWVRNIPILSSRLGALTKVYVIHNMEDEQVYSSTWETLKLIRNALARKSPKGSIVFDYRGILSVDDRWNYKNEFKFAREKKFHTNYFPPSDEADVVVLLLTNSLLSGTHYLPRPPSTGASPSARGKQILLAVHIDKVDPRVTFSYMDKKVVKLSLMEHLNSVSQRLELLNDSRLEAAVETVTDKIINNVPKKNRVRETGGHPRNILPPPNPYNVRRGALHGKVRKRLFAESSNLVAIFGPPGVGKTELARECVRDFRRYFDYVFWTYRPQNFTQLLCQVFRQLPDNPEIRGVSELTFTYAWLSRSPNWLIVCDDLSLEGIPAIPEAKEQQSDNSESDSHGHKKKSVMKQSEIDEILSQYFSGAEDFDNTRERLIYNPDDCPLPQILPDGSQRKVLVTTVLPPESGLQCPSWLPRPTEEDKIECPVFTTDEATKFFSKRCPGALHDDNGRFAMDVCKKVGFLPIALNIVAAYIAQKGYSFSKYSKAIEKALPSSENIRSETDYLQNYFEVIGNMSIDAVEDASNASKDLLNISGFADGSSIPFLILERGTEKLGPRLQNALNEGDTKANLLRKLVGPLNQFGLVTTDFSEKSFSIHKSIQVLVTEMMDEGAIRKWAEIFIEALNLIFPDPAKDTERPLCEKLQPQAMQAATLMHKYEINSKESEGLFTRTAELLSIQGNIEDSAALLEKHLAKNDLLFAKAHMKLGNIHNARAEYRFAVGHFEKSLDKYKKHFGEYHHDVAHAIHLIGQCLHRLGKIDDAKINLEESFKIRKELAKPDYNDRNLAVSMNDLALNRRAQGRHNEADNLLKESYRIYKNILGENDPDTITVQRNLERFVTPED